MKKIQTQYTVRNIPKSLDSALRKKAENEKKSLNTVLLEALSNAAGLGKNAITYHDLDALSGSWVEDREVEKALKIFSKVNAKDWE